MQAVAAPPGNVGPAPGGLIGRDQNVVEVALMVREHRLVSLTGIGGIGKTRLALAVAGTVRNDFPDGVWFVELAPLTDAAGVAETVAGALAITCHPGRSIAESVAATIGSGRVLLVLDNCEHVLDAAAVFVEHLLRDTAASVLTTTRESFGFAGERIWAVPALDTGGIASAAVTLFVERATAANPAFRLDATDDVDAVVEVCERLDGIALAIELAAARMVSMSARELRDRLGDRFRLLAGRRRTTDRHATLRHAVQWSYDLLDEAERDVLDRCSVFSDGFDLAAVTAVCEHGDDLEVLDHLDSLTRKSLITVDTSAGTTRFALLETIRQFAEERCVERGDAGAIRARHAAHYAAQVESQWERWNSPHQRLALDWAVVEFANLRAAYRWAVDAGDLRVAVAIAAHLAIMMWPLNRFEAVGWAEDIVPLAEKARCAQLPRLHVAAGLCLFLGRPDDAAVYAAAAGELARSPGLDPLADGWSDFVEGTAHVFAGRFERTVDICHSLTTRPGFPRMVGLAGLAWILPAIGRADEGIAVADEALELARALGNPFWIQWALGSLAQALATHDPERALAAQREGLRYAAEHRLPFGVANLANLAQGAATIEAELGHLEESLELFSMAIDAFVRAGNVVFLAATMASLSVAFDRLGHPAVAATLYGASTTQPSIGATPHLAETLEHLQATLGHAYAEHVATGAAMTPSDVARFARLHIVNVAREAGSTSGAPAPTDTAGLSPREREILKRLAAGESNNELAAHLFISVATVERHVANLYRKIGVRRRAQAVQYAFEHDLQ
jgi:predicted ATPase/DNA-binding CsgD family transcriptional regulator